ncbi:hypothetical protein B0H16DRAFT_1856640 [Mycena metata]|uniref:Transmembrane protein n=1 Tax=Mycena metata TaxID=1033252 RepID=A0AAD7IMW9_9AGAR|nr:hypothetical protein B0H16DRAFT_1856640 [Mycena metata]
MSGLLVIVDDQDTDIHFSTGWGPTSAAIAFEYGGTITNPGPQGATATYQFNGTSISVFARIAAGNATTTINWAIDDMFSNSTVVQGKPFERFHEQLFSSPSLRDGQHTFVITLTDITSSDVCLDYMIYEASPTSNLGAAARLLALETSPQLTYSEGWNSGVILRPELALGAVSLNDSVKCAADLGGTVAFSFTGSGFEVHGLLVTPYPSPVAAYSLDGGPLMPVEMPPNGTDFTNAVSNFPFVGRAFGEVGTHSLVITPLIPAAFFLDYIIVQTPTAFFPEKADIAVLPASTSSNSAGPTITMPSSTPTPGRLDSGGIAAVILGITLALSIVFALLYLLRRRHTIIAPQDEGDRVVDAERAHSEVTPYTVLTAEVLPKMGQRYAVRRSADGVQAKSTRRVSNIDSTGTSVAVLPPAYSDRETGSGRGG